VSNNSNLDEAGWIGRVWSVCAVVTVSVVASWVAAAADVSPTTAVRELQLGYVAFDRGDFESAMAHYRSALDLAKGVEQRFNANLGLGSAAFELGRLDEARTALEEAHRLKPAEAGATFTLGVVCRRLGDLDRAAQLLAEAAVRAPDMTVAFVELGIVYGAMGRHAEAERVCREAIELEPDNLEARLGLAVALFHQDEHEPAVTEFETILASEPGNIRAHYGLGLALLYSGDRDGAINQLVYLKEHAPDLADELYGWVFPDD
jgi:tetratricopeptide (TPR) repeat protein